MEKAEKKFLQEAFELVDDLERSVLELEKDHENSQQAEEVFRVMHTFKGTAKMFGYDKIGEFTHHLETIFDDIRSNRQVLSPEILEISLQSVDYIRQQLATTGADDVESSNTLIERVKKISNAPSTVSSASASGSSQTFLIHFAPHSTFLRDGSNPLYLLEDLSAHGSIVVNSYTQAIPNYENFKPDEAYIRWDILLYTQQPVKTIRQEFLFVEDQCQLEINSISSENLLINSPFLSFFKQRDHKHELSQIKLFLEKEKPVAKVSSSTKPVSPQSIKVTYDKIDKLMSIVSELVTTQARLSLLTTNIKNQELEEITENVEKLVRQLRDESFSISLLPISHFSMRFERLIRDISRELNKKVQFVTSGGETELDKKIIENLADPMLHLLRNSLDHGIESPAIRNQRGKNETGTIQLKAYYSGANVIIEIKDDGAGIDKNKVLAKALEKELIRENDTLSEQEIFQLIFHPGFSTAHQVTDISGRGVGMDVVRKAIKNLRGEIEVESVLHKGTTFRLILPLSLSIIDGLLVRIENSQYVIPLTSIEKCFEVESKTIQPDMNGWLVLEGEKVPYINLRESFCCTGSQPEVVNLIVAKQNDQKVAFQVDAIIDEYQAVIKPLGKIYKDQDFASGATILGNGTVALVLDTNRLVTSLSA